MKTFKITGMKCDHCRQNVENAIKAVKGVTQATVSLETATATAEGDFSDDDLKAAVAAAGFRTE